MHFNGFYLIPVILCLASVASAQEEFTGTVGIQEENPLTGAFTDTSLTLDALNFTEPGSATETFDGTVPDGTEVTAYSTTISGLSSDLAPVSISDFLEIGTAGPVAFGSPGTTPTNRFDFNLQYMAETDAVDGEFIGYGTLVDTQGDYADTPAELALSFSNADTYSFVLEAVPEPATLTLLLGGVGMLPFLRRKL